MTVDLLDPSRGFFRVPRSLFDDQHPLSAVRSREDATKLWALVDLMQLATWQDYHDRRRGEARVGLGFLAGRWRWTKPRVSRFLTMLAESGTIEWEPGHGSETGLIRIIRYDDLQAPIRGTPALRPGDTPPREAGATPRKANDSGPARTDALPPQGGPSRDPRPVRQRNHKKEEEPRGLSEGHEGEEPAELFRGLADRMRGAAAAPPRGEPPVSVREVEDLFGDGS